MVSRVFSGLIFALFLVLAICGTGNAAEWKAEPGINIRTIYSDNVGMRSIDEKSSSGYSVQPQIIVDGSEPNWDINIDGRFRATRYNNVEASDSDNVFFNFGTAYLTERNTFKLNGSFERNSSFDTDPDTELPSSGLFSDHTERESTNISPSWTWRSSESSSVSLNLMTSDVEYDEVSSANYRDYEIDSASINSIWSVGSRSQVGFTYEFTQYQSETITFPTGSGDVSQYLEFDQSVYQLEYVYSYSEISKINLSLGSRKVKSDSHGEFVCDLVIAGFCFVPTYQDIHREDDGTVVNASYTRNSEITSIAANLSRSVEPSSYGGAYEKAAASIRYGKRVSERFRTSILLEGTETTAIQGLPSENDRKRYRVEPSASWKLSRDWDLSFIYRYIKQDFTEIDTVSKSNAVFLNLNMTWPRLVSTY